MAKQLVAYFSPTGTTARAAHALAEAAGADLYEIAPERLYSAADLNWNDRASRSSVEMNDATSRPVLADADANIGAYDTIFIGFPIWWYTTPRIINSFLEAYDFTGKQVVLFATSGGSGLGSCATDLAASAPGARMENGRLLNGRLDPVALKEFAAQSK